MPRPVEERDRQRLADAEEAHDHVGSAHERRREVVGRVDDERVRVVLDLGAAAELHRHPRAQLDVDELVDGKARRHRDEIDGRAALEERAQRRAHASPVRCSWKAAPVHALRAATSAGPGMPLVSKVPQGICSTSGRSRR